MQRLRPMIERSRHNPYEIALAISLLALSIYGVVFHPASASIDRGMTEPMRIAYGSIGILGSAMTLAGLKLKDEQLGLIVEAIGQVFMCGGAATFVVTLCAVSTFASSGLVSVTGAAICGAAGCRVWQILRDVKRYRILIAAATELQATMGDLEGLTDAD